MSSDSESSFSYETESDLDYSSADEDSTKIKWKEVVPTFENTQLTISGSQDVTWSNAKREFQHIMNKLPGFVGVSSMSEVTFEHLLSIFFGPRSPFATTLMKVLNLEYDVFVKFMDYWCLQAITKRDTKNCTKVVENLLITSDRTAKDIIPMEKEDYEDCWKHLCTIGDSGTLEDTIRGGNYSWQLLQDDFNNIMRGLYTLGNRSKYSIVVDDDKVWIENYGKNAEQQFNIKWKQFTRDNRKGLVIHSFVSTGLLLLVNLQVEQDGDTDRKCLYRGLNSLFGKQSEDSLSLDPNTSVRGDRGYIDEHFMLQVTSCGADASGTCKRLPWYPMTYDQRLRGPKDKRSILQSSGNAALFIREAKINNTTVSAAAFRNGSSTIACSISTEHHMHQWDGIPLSDTLNGAKAPSTNVFNLFERMEIETTNDDSFQPHEKKILRNYIMEDIDVLTVKQQTADWHLRRKFSLSSKQTYDAFVKMFPLAYNGGGTTRNHFVTVAETIWGDNWNSMNKNLLPEHLHDNAKIHKPQEELQSFIKHCTSNSTNPNMDDRLKEDGVIIWLKTFVDNNFACDNDDAANLYYANAESQGSYFLPLLKNFLLRRIPEDERTSSSPTKRDLYHFMCHKNEIRKWMFYDPAKLKPTISAYGITRVATTKMKICAQLLDGEKNFTQLNQTEMKRSIQKSTIKSLINSSFLERFTDARKTACARGNKCEPILVTNFVNGVNEGDIVLEYVEKVVGVYTTGLIASQELPYVKDSIDFIMIVKIKDSSTGTIKDYGFVLGEAKTRVSSRALSEERNLHRKRNGADNHSTFGRCKSLHQDLRVATERFQVLHHALSWNCCSVVHVIGDKNGLVEHSHLVDFRSSTLNSYENVCKYLHKYTLKWAYNDDDNEPVPDVVLKLSKDLKQIGSEEAFLSTYYLWKNVNNQFPTTPMAPLKRIIPRQHAQWNAEKSGSDINTKLADSLCLLHPNPNLGSRAVNRLITNAMVNVHRLFHVLRMQVKFDSYVCLKQYYGNSSRQHSFLDTILDARKKYFMPKSVDAPTAENIGGSAATPPAPTPPARGTRSNTIAAAKVPSYSTKRTGFTPISTNKKQRRIMLDPASNNPFGTRARACCGILVQIVCDSEDRGNCVVCNLKTRWFCVGCNMWFCNSSRSVDHSIKKEWVCKEVNHPTRTSSMEYYETCAIKHHMDALNKWKQTTEQLLE